jgi:molybdenum cofactor cytidylyltransferase
MPLAAILLAAGGSSRLGRPKQLLRVAAETLLVRGAKLARETVTGPVIVVIGSGHLRLRSVLRRHRLAVDVVYNPAWAKGMAGSLRMGLRRVPANAGGALILLVDQAKLGAKDLKPMVDRWQRRPGDAAAASFGGYIGAPAIIPRRWFRAASSGSGDQGARRLLRGLTPVTTVSIAAAAVDIDTPADLAALEA